MRRVRLLRVLILLFSILLPGGATSVALAAQSTADVPVSVKQKESALQELLGPKLAKIQREEEYIIGHGDIVTVSIYEEGDMSASSVQGEEGVGSPGAGTGNRVMMDGRISLKNIGDVEVVGLTLTELANYLKKLYASIYDNPIITTTLVQSNSLRYTVMGQVPQPGIFQLDHPMTLVQVIARSSGFTEWSSRKITVVRKELTVEDEKQFKGNTLKFDYDSFVSGKALERNIFIRSGDIVIVD
jgi:polysaccharide export outer membrane protein